MLSLELDVSKYFRVKENTTKEDIERTFCIPVNCDLFLGAIISIDSTRYKKYFAKLDDTYQSIARSHNVDIDILMVVNGNRQILPTGTIYIPISDDYK